MKLQKLLLALKLIVQKPYLINEILQNEERYQEAIAQKYGRTEGLPVIDFTQIADASLSANPYAFLDGGSLPTDLILLKSLAKNIEECTYFEIGTWRGESVANVAQVAKHCYTLNQSEEEMKTQNWSKALLAQIRFFSKNIKNITHLEGNSYHFDFKPYHKKINLIFIDGNHTYLGVKNDTQKAFSLLKDEHSILVWHDYANHPDSVRWEVFQGILDGLPISEHKNLYTVQHTKCAIYTKTNWQSSKPQNPTTPKHTFEVSVKVK